MDEMSKNDLAIEKYRNIILNSIADGVFTVNNKKQITSFNKAAERITGISSEEAIGRPCYEVFRANVCESGCILEQTIKTGQSIVNMPIYIVRADKKQIHISVSTALLRDKSGNVIGGVETFRDLTEINELRNEIRKQHSFGDIISKSEKMIRLFGILPQIANSNSTVLIEGASGTGKELIARAIHNNSPRREKPFVAVNCGALPDPLLESELFGYVAGAFTDAKKDKPGRFAMAKGGTIFLDEIGDISQALQVRLLRVLQERVYDPLGAVKSVNADVRVITATNKTLEDLIKKGIFRDDLYYRINVIKLSLPTLSERKEDIPLLVEHFIDHFNHITGKGISGVSDGAMAAIMHHNWPGNIRELENTIEHAFVLCQDGLIRLRHLPRHLIPEDRSMLLTAGKTLKEIEKRAIQETLMRNNWKRMATARELGIDKNTLRRKMIRFGIKEK